MNFYARTALSEKSSTTHLDVFARQHFTKQDKERARGSLKFALFAHATLMKYVR